MLVYRLHILLLIFPNNVVEERETSIAKSDNLTCPWKQLYPSPIFSAYMSIICVQLFPSEIKEHIFRIKILY
jgi:hypothetical protein